MLNKSKVEVKSKKKSDHEKGLTRTQKTNIDTMGGQAVMGGVMMRSKTHYAIAVRKPDGSIEAKAEKVKSITDKFKFLKTPFIRGVIYLFEMMILGMKALSWSAQQSTDEKDEQLSNKEIVITVVISIVFALLLFVGLPFFLTSLVVSKGFLFDLLDGFVRITVLVIYLLIISLMDDIKELFRYHGAEHKTVSCYEHNLELTVKNIKKFSTKHPRCGTSFIIFVFLLSILVYSLINGSWVIELVARIVMLPVIAGLGYELLRFSSKHVENPIIKALIQPGLWLQKITTKEPSAKQIEVAIYSLNEAVKSTVKT